MSHQSFGRVRGIVSDYISQVRTTVDVMRWTTVFRYLLVFVTLPVWLIPIFTMIYITLKPTEEIAREGFWALPDTIALVSNLHSAWTEAAFQTFAINSFIYATVGGILAVLVSSLAAFTLARLEIRGTNAIFFSILLFMFFPFQMYLIPLVNMSHAVDLYNTRSALIIVYIAVAIPFSVFLLRNYFITISESLHEAGQIDGLSTFQVFWLIYLPLAKPALAVALIFQWVWIWNEFLFGLVLTTSESTRPISTGLAMIGTTATPWPVVMAGAIITALPSILIYFSLQKYFERGLLSM